FSSRRRHTSSKRDWSSDVCSSDLSANLFLSATDPMLGEMTIDAAAIIDPTYAETMNVAMNYYFLAVSVFVLTFVGAWVTERVVEPRLGTYDGKYRETLDTLQ